MAVKRVQWDRHQLTIDWTAAARSPPPVPPVQFLPWDFKTTFPAVLPEVVDAGTIAEEDTMPENLAGLHAQHGVAMRQVLTDLDRVRDARRRGVDPATGKVPRKLAKRAELPVRLGHEIERLERWWEALLGTYGEVFGDEAATAFGKHNRATHAGIEVRTASEVIQRSPDRQPLSSPG